MRRLLVLSALVLASTPRLAVAYGESNADGFPNWSERVLHEWTNRARCEPAIEMAACGATKCPEGACYTPIAPVYYSQALNRAARFHAESMAAQGYFAHDSACTLVSGISGLYPSSCTGAASCACVGGTKACSPTCTSWSSRVGMFGASASGEIIASSSDPNSAFYQWLYEAFSKTTCAYDSGPPTNGHRWNLLKAGPNIGFGTKNVSVGDFGGGGTAYKIPSAGHYPRQSASIEVWANWYDTAAPSSAVVNVDGACVALARTRGSNTNGAWKATLTAYASGCHRYYVEFKDSGGTAITYPTTGSLGMGPAGSCADWDATRPAACGGVVTDAGVSDTGSLDTGTLDTGTVKPDTGSSVPDTSTGPTDTGGGDTGSVAIDTGSVTLDTGAPSTDADPDDTSLADDSGSSDDASTDSDGGPAADPASDMQGSCACRVGTKTDGTRTPALATCGLLLVLAARRRRRRALGALAVSAALLVGCKDYHPGPLNPAPNEAGKKHCSSGADCASGVCGTDGRCL